MQPVAHDQEIENRLQNILEATQWYQSPQVRVDEGVLFLSGTADTIESKDWATRLGHNTQDVVAVINKMNVAEPEIWNFRPALGSWREMWASFIRSIPYFAVALGTLVATFGLTIVGHRLAHLVFRRRVAVPLLREVIAKSVALAIVLFGLYIVLRVSGLTRLALTVVGGTGILGLVIGIAFRDITENFLASILLSIQRPFRVGDLVEIVGVRGFVDRLTIRTTVLMTMDGNQVQIPNATVYKNTIRNFTSNPKHREDFAVGVGYDAPLAEAQSAALAVLDQHPAILKEPEPWVLAESFGESTINLRVYYWLDLTEHNALKVRSSVIRLVKTAFEAAGIPVPDTAREVLFPKEVPIRLLDGARDADSNGKPRSATRSPAGKTSQAGARRPPRNPSPPRPKAAWQPRPSNLKSSPAIPTRPTPKPTCWTATTRSPTPSTKPARRSIPTVPLVARPPDLIQRSAIDQPWASTLALARL